MEEIQGLTESEARERRERGLGNDVEVRTGRTYRDIVRANLFTTYNNILFVIGVALVALGRYYDAATSVGIGLVNALIGTAQEVRAKRQLDRVALVSTPRVTVVEHYQAHNYKSSCNWPMIQSKRGAETYCRGIEAGKIPTRPLGPAALREY